MRKIPTAGAWCRAHAACTQSCCASQAHKSFHQAFDLIDKHISMVTILSCTTQAVEGVDLRHKVYVDIRKTFSGSYGVHL